MMWTQKGTVNKLGHSVVFWKLHVDLNDMKSSEIKGMDLVLLDLKTAENVLFAVFFGFSVPVKCTGYNINCFVFVLSKIQHAGQNTSDLETGWDEHSRIWDNLTRIPSPLHKHHCQHWDWGWSASTPSNTTSSSQKISSQTCTWSSIKRPSQTPCQTERTPLGEIAQPLPLLTTITILSVHAAEWWFFSSMARSLEDLLCRELTSYCLQTVRHSFWWLKHLDR